MPPAGRLGDYAHAPVDAHGCPACPHSPMGPAVAGSPDVLVNGLPALRVGDPGMHFACCGSNLWSAQTGSSTVFFNDLPVHRQDDLTMHCGGQGRLVMGSGDVIVGDRTPRKTAYTTPVIGTLQLLNPDGVTGRPGEKFKIYAGNRLHLDSQLDEQGQYRWYEALPNQATVSFYELFDDAWAPATISSTDNRFRIQPGHRRRPEKALSHRQRLPISTSDTTTFMQIRRTVGVNLPWYDCGWDFGDVFYDGAPRADRQHRWEAHLEQDLVNLSELGVTIVRWFVLADGRSYGTGAHRPHRLSPITQPERWDFLSHHNTDAATQGASSIVSDFRKCLSVFERVNSRIPNDWPKIKIQPVLMSFEMFLPPPADLDTSSHLTPVPGGRDQILSNNRKMRRFIQDIVTPFQAAISAYRAHVHSIDIFNEPEWCLLDDRQSFDVNLRRVKELISAVQRKLVRLRLPLYIGIAHQDASEARWGSHRTPFTALQGIRGVSRTLHYYGRNYQAISARSGQRALTSHYPTNAHISEVGTPKRLYEGKILPQIPDELRNLIVRANGDAGQDYEQWKGTSLFSRLNNIRSAWDSTIPDPFVLAWSIYSDTPVTRHQGQTYQIGDGFQWRTEERKSIYSYHMGSAVLRDIGG